MTRPLLNNKLMSITTNTNNVGKRKFRCVFSVTIGVTCVFNGETIVSALVPVADTMFVFMFENVSSRSVICEELESKVFIALVNFADDSIDNSANASPNASVLFFILVIVA